MPGGHTSTSAAFVCVFREPTVSARSMVKEARAARYLIVDPQGSDGELRAQCLDSMFQHVLLRHRSEGDWIFIHYDQLFDADAHGPFGGFSRDQTGSRLRRPASDEDASGRNGLTARRQACTGSFVGLRAMQVRCTRPHES